MSSAKDIPRKTAWIAAIAIVMVFILPILVISFPAVTLPGIRAMNVTSLRTPPYAESGRAVILDESNWTQWHPASPQSGFSLNFSASGLLLTGTFPPSSDPLALSISRDLTVNLTAYPIMYMLIQVSTSASYGIRFYSQSSGFAAPLWSESDALNHRSGTGQSENLQVNMPQLIESSTGKVFNELNSVTVYVERPASSQSVAFSLQFKKFEFLNFPLTSSSTPGSYHALYFGLSQVEQNLSESLRSVQLQGRVNATAGTILVPYFFQGMGVYQGSVYIVNTTQVNVSISIPITAQGVKSFSDNLPTETTAIVLVAAAGSFNQMIVTNIFLNYYSKTAQGSPVQPSGSNVYISEAFFIIVLPASVIALAYVELRRKGHAETRT